MATAERTRPAGEVEEGTPLCWMLGDDDDADGADDASQLLTFP